MDCPITEQEIRRLIIANTEKVFSTMLDLPVQVLDAGHANDLMEGGVVALVGFAGKWSGSGSVACSANLACLLSGKMLLTTFNQVNEEVLDAMGEIGNMIIGNFKDDAAAKLGTLGLSTPTVIYGQHLQARNWNGNICVAVWFVCAGEVFEVKVSLIASLA